MTALAFVYPGQGAQRVGMGAALKASDPDLFDSWFAAAETASGLPLRRFALKGPREMLTRTDVAQPALVALSLALTEVAQRSGLRPTFVAGHSLGEYTAAVVAGALRPIDGLRLVAERGRLMAAVQAAAPGGMGAIVGLPVPAIRELCARVGGVAVANLNAPRQVVVSGAIAAVAKVLAAAHEAGASQTIRLEVGAAFHSTAMESVRDQLGLTAADLSWRVTSVPLVTNVSGAVVSSGSDVRTALIHQITNEVRWIDCVRTIIDAGCRTFLELGPGRVLSSLVRQIEPAAEVIAADRPDALTALAGRYAQ